MKKKINNHSILIIKCNICLDCTQNMIGKVSKSHLPGGEKSTMCMRARYNEVYLKEERKRENNDNKDDYAQL